MNVVYVTGNQHKAKYFSKMVGLEIEHISVDVVEIQSLDFNTMPQWHGGDELLRTLPLLIVDRLGYPLLHEPADAVILSVTTTDDSSSEVRRRLDVGDSVEGLVPPTVFHLIK